VSESGPEGHQEWDERYADAPVWSGRPNGALVAEVSGLGSGRALDVGCGEGADAVWLAQRGWSVTAIDVAVTALDRGRVAASSVGAVVEWRLAGLLDLDPGSTVGVFDLVSAQYPALRRAPDLAPERALLAAVAPGGTLLVVTHADIDRAAALEKGFDPDEYVGHDQVRDALDAAAADGWVVEVDERRERHVEGGGGAHHTHDVVLRARRAD